MISENNNNTEHQLDLDPPVQEQSGETVGKKYNFRNETIYKLVDHSVGAIAHDCGYHIAHQSSLDVLTDVCCDYFKKIATLLRTAHDTEELRDSNSDFVDALERVFHQVNVPSSANLHQFVCKIQAVKRYQQKQQAQQQANNDTNSNNETP